MTGRTRRLRRGTAASAAVLGIASIAAATAFGHIPGVGNGLPPTTNGPDLRSVDVSGNSPGDGLTEKARYCFDSAIDTITAAAKAAPSSFFNVQTYDSRRSMGPSSVDKDTTNASCLIATFASGLDLAQATVGEVVPDAVRDLQARANGTASEPVIGSVAAPRLGATTGPDLTDVIKDTTARTLRFVFDEDLNPAPAVAYDATTGFAYYNDVGTATFGIAAPAPIVSGKSITVSFASSPVFDNSTRFVANDGAVQDRPQSFAFAGAPSLFTPSAAGIVNKGAASARPEVTSAIYDSAQAFRISFSQPIALPAGPSGFRAITDDASPPIAASDVTLITGNQSTVLVTFPSALLADPAGVVKIVVNSNSIKAQDGVTGNIASEVSLPTPANAAPGYTNGPDLLAVGVDLVTNRVTYKFDEAVGPVPATTALRGIAADGSSINSTGGVVVSGVFVTANYPVTLTGAVAFDNIAPTVFDSAGHPGPHQSVSKQIQTGPPPPPPPPPPGVVPPPPPPPPIAVTPKPRFKTTVTINRRGRVYSGTVNSSRKACRQGRRVILKRPGKDARFGTAFSSRTGAYKITRKRRINRRVYVYVTGRSTSINCLPAKSKTILG